MKDGGRSERWGKVNLSQILYYKTQDVGKIYGLVFFQVGLFWSCIVIFAKKNTFVNNDKC
jgi:hypothetical protein